MRTKKIIIATVAIAALALTLVGVAAAQVTQNQFYANTAPNTQAPNNGFWGWVGNCFGLRTAQANQGQYVAPPAQAPPTQVNTPAPTATQGGNGYNYGYGYGPCMAGW